jgi:hypothetical protein
MKSNFFVFDTNILLSAMFNDASTPAAALKKARGKGILLISEDVATEYIRVFSRAKFDKYVPEHMRFEFLENIISNALNVLTENNITDCRDPKDNKFLDLAITGKAGCIVSGDDDLLSLNPFRGVTILNPIDFLHNY